MALLYINTYFQLDCGSLSTSKEFSVASLNWNTACIVLTFFYVQNYKHTYDIFNVYKMYKVKAWESSSGDYSLRESVGLEGRVVSGSDLIPLQYVWKDLVNV